MKAKTLLTIAFVAFFAMCCKKEEETESDMIVKEYGDEYTLQLYNKDSLYLDINDDGENDVLVYLNAFSLQYPDKIFVPLSANICIGMLNSYNALSFGEKISDKILWGNSLSEKIYWLSQQPTTDDEYIAVKITTDSKVNYGWILPMVKEANDPIQLTRQILAIKKTAYCTTSGKEIYAGQEE